MIIRVEGMDMIDMRVVKMIIKKTLPSSYQNAFITEWAAIDVSYEGVREKPGGGGIRDPERLLMRMWIKEHHGRKQDIDPTALYSTQTFQQIRRYKKDFAVTYMSRVLG